MGSVGKRISGIGKLMGSVGKRVYGAEKAVLGFGITKSDIVARLRVVAINGW